MEYTKLMEEKLFENIGDEEEDITGKVLKFLNHKDSFRSFGEGLTYMIQQKNPDAVPINFLRNQMRAKGIVISDSTVRGWFEKGARPKRGIKSRETMYKLCFLLEMNMQETEVFFRKVFYDRPFNLRDVNEFVYCYCIRNGYDYKHACDLLEAVDKIEDSDEATVFSVMLINDIGDLKSDEEVIQYIRGHSHSFFKKGESAKEVLNLLLEQLLVTDDEKDLLRAGKDGPYQSYIAKECNMFPDILLREGADLTSKSFMLDIIEGVNMREIAGEKSKKLFECVNLPREILSRFPMKQIFTEIEDSKDRTIFEEIRKMIILLYSYQFWFEIEYEGHEDWDLDVYISQMNVILEQACLQELYYGNPYDWLFLYCTLSEEPLKTFRSILAAAVFSEENEDSAF